MQTEFLPGAMMETDDSKVIACLEYHNRLAALEQPRLTGAFRQFVFWAHGTTFYVGQRCMGYDLPEDNGYTLLAIDLNVMSDEQAAQIAQAFVDAGHKPGRSFLKWEKCDETSN